MATRKRKTTNHQKAPRTKAQEYYDPDRVLALIRQAVHKAKGLTDTRGPLKKVWASQKTMFRMVQAYARGEYTYVPKDTILLALLAIVYFVSPIDIIPDLIPGIGHLDDAAVIGFVLASIKQDLDKFAKWEDKRISRQPSRTTSARMRASAN